MQLLVIFIRGRSNAHSNAAGCWVSTGPSNACALSAAKRAIFTHIQS
jgi:hypothetical protein